MKDFITNQEYQNIKNERLRFHNLYVLLKLDCLEIIKEDRKDKIITYFCLAYNKYDSYITFYNKDGEDLIQVRLDKRINIYDYFKEDLIEEVNVSKPIDDFTYRGFNFKYLEEPVFISQLFDNIAFEDTDLIKEIDNEIEYYKDKTIEERKELFDYTNTNNIINQYKYKYKLS